jgi:flagellar biosynthesis/type III secretory pathway ATPase
LSKIEEVEEFLRQDIWEKADFQASVQKLLSMFGEGEGTKG